MKTKRFTIKKTIVALLACIPTVFAALLLTPSGLAVFAAFSGQSSGMSRAELHAATMATSVNSDTATLRFNTTISKRFFDD